MKQSWKHVRFWKRLASTILSIVMLVGLLPTATYAAVGTLVRNSALENTALMQALQEAYGEDAQAYWSLLRSYGLVDDAGNLITDEEIVVDGKSYTLDELEAYLAQPGLDLSQVATVDGIAITLEDLKTVIEIERYLAYIQATYFTKQTLSDAQKESFYNLADAWANGEVEFLSADPLEGVGPAGINHSVCLNVTAAASAAENGSYTVSVAPSQAQTTDITFAWRALTGSAAASGSGTATIPAGSTEAVQFTVQVGAVQGTTSDSGIFLVQIYDVKNALFYGGKDVWEQTVSVRGQMDYAYQFQGTDSLVSMHNEYYYAGAEIDGDGLFRYGNREMEEVEKIEDFTTRPETMQITLPSLDPNGIYTGELEIEAIFDRTNTDPEFNTGSVRPKFWEYYRNDSTDENLPPMQLASVRFTGNGTELVTDKLLDEEYEVGTEQLHWYWKQDNWLDSDQIQNLSDQTYTIGMAFQKFHLALTYVYGSPSKVGDYYFRPDVPSCEATLTVRETTTQTTASLSAPAGTYYAGQSVPITVSFAYPMVLDDTMTLTVNGKELTPEETGSTARSCTFLYPVDQTSGASLNLTDANLSGTGANGLPVSVSVEADSPIQVGGSAADITLNSLCRADAFAAYQMAVSIQPDTKQPVLIVTIPLTEVPASNWILNEVGNDGVLHALQVQTSQTGAQKYPFQLDDLQSPTALTATVSLPYNTSTEDIQGQVDFFLDGAVMIGKGLCYTVAGSIPVQSGDMNPVFTVQTDDGGTTEYTPEDTAPVLYAQQNNRMTLQFELEDKAYTWGDRTKISYYDADGQVVDPSAHFAWKSSDPSVAAVFVDSLGNASVTATGRSGSVNLTLVAFNDALSDSESDPIAVTFAVGQDPFLLIPDSGAEVTIREGQDAVIHWSSNLCQKNETAGPDGTLVPTTFQVRLYSSTGEISDAEPIWSADLTTDADHTTLFSATIPWDGVLQAIYEAGARSARVEVSAQYQGKTYGTYRENGAVAAEDATAVIQIFSKPASVTLQQPEGGLYQTDGGTGKTLTLHWTLDHLDTVAGGQFELYVASTNKAFGTDGILTETGTEVGNTGSYTLNIPAVTTSNDPASYRDSYTVTVKAKNAAESTWAYSSYVLYVYSDSALQILIDGAQAAASLSMSNNEQIAQLWGAGGEQGSEAIVALQRDIALRHVISANYGQYAWAELADQIAWQSSDSAVASVNYQQGTLYENIENFSYTSYRPSTDFILSGLKDGQTTITATHVQTGITDSVTVKVDTLRDKLYLFQCYPKTETTLTYSVYTDAARTRTEQMVLTSNAAGEAAIYAPYGIAGNVYCQSTATEQGDNVTYLGTIYGRNLVSSEADSTKLQLYPVNTLQLRRAAQVELYLKTPDGLPYANQEVTFRGGVYREGVYCSLDQVQFGLQGAERDQWQLGNVQQTVTTDENGRLLVAMDLSQFKSSPDQKEVQAGEKLYYIFQLDYGDGTSAEYYPMFHRVDANLNLEDVVATGEHILFWEENTTNAMRPYIAQQTLQYSESPKSSVLDVREKSNTVGPSETFPQAWLTTTVMWWGSTPESAAKSANVVKLQDTNGKVPDGQQSKSTVYPFTDVAFTKHVIRLDETVMDNWGIGPGEKRSAQMTLSRDGTTVDATITLPFQIVNMLDIQKAEDSSTLTDTIGDLKENMDVDASESLMGVGDAMLLLGLNALAGDAAYNSEQDTFAVRLFATNDPTVFRAFFCVNLGNMGSDDNVTGVYPQYTDMENMAFVDVDSITKPGDADLLPNPLNVYRMAKGTYLDSAGEDAMKAINSKAVRGFNMDLGGYYEADIVYNSENGQWECRPISGGFHVGGGVNYSWYVNTLVGVVPVNISMTLGATLEIRMDTQRGHYYNVTNGMPTLEAAENEEAFETALSGATYTEQSDMDYLTQLRIFLYAKAFAGVGFDISVLALKIGVFGQINGDFNFSWLNRDYLNNSQNISAVGPVDSRKDDLMFGFEPRFSGSTGIEFVVKLLFINYEKIFCSVGFEFEGRYGDQKTIDEIWAANQTINNEPVQRMAMPNGQYLYAVDLGAQLESRDYVDASPQVWMGGLPTNTLSLDQEQGVADVLQKGAYSYANPVVSDDGTLLFYLSDRVGQDADSAKDVTNTRVAVSQKVNNQFQEGVRLENDLEVPTGYGDSNLKAAGQNGGYAAVWVRQMENITPEDTEQGSGTLTGGQQMLQMNSTEIVAATSQNGSDWTLHRLTDNTTPDLAPVVATNGTFTVVAWREVNSSSVDQLTDFDQQDAIRYAVYDGQTWSSVQTLYEGSGTDATVKGLEMAMLDDGTAAVIYTLDQNATDDRDSDWETILAIIPAAVSRTEEDGESQDNIRTFQLTSDDNLDENPQITTIRFDDGVQRFVAAWHTEQSVGSGNDTQSDIRLVAMDANGVCYETMPESLRQATDGTGATVGSNFRFAKQADTVENLSILWVDTQEAEDGDDQTHNDLISGVASGYGRVGHDVLQAVKFVPSGNSFTVSGATTVADMPANTLIDHFDVYLDDQKQLRSVILGTDYSETTTRTVEISDGTESGTQSVSMTVANPVSGMYTATAEFVDQFDLSAIMLEYDNLYPNSDIDVQFTIRNSGKSAITNLEILADDVQQPVYTSGETALHLLPNRDLTVSAKFPTGETIENVAYTIRATFESGESREYKDILHLDIPDVGISKVETVREENGQRTLRYSLYNMLSAKLADTADNWRVQVGFFADLGCTTPLLDQEGNALTATIENQKDLALIDAGAYSAEVTLPVHAYMTDESGVTQEIPAEGIPVYTKVWLEAPMEDGTAYDTVTEYIDSNNTTSTLLENLAQRRKEDVTVETELDNSGTLSNVTVDVQYNKLTGTTSGNLIVTLLDQNGQPLETLQSYTDSHHLLELSNECHVQEQFTFSQKGNAVKVTFSDLILDQDSVELDHVSLTGADVTYDAATKTYTAVGVNLDSGILEIAPKDPQNAKIMLNGEVYDINSQKTISLTYGITNWDITVVNGSNQEHYKLVLNNTDTTPSSGGNQGSSNPLHDITLSQIGKGTASVAPTTARNGQSVTITTTPDEGYKVGTIIVTKANGATVSVTNKGDGIYTFTMPNSNVEINVAFVPVSDWSNPFADVPMDAWYYEAVRYVSENSLMTGYSENLFGPNDDLTRSQLAQILYNLDGKPSLEGENLGYPFQDVPGDAWFADAVYWARLHGIVTGYSDTQFGADDHITREQLAVMLWRYAQYKGYDADANGSLSAFSDQNKVAPWSEEAITWAVRHGLISGMDDGTLSPQGKASRAQVATILMQFRQNLVK